MLQVENVHFRYGAFSPEVLQGASLTLEQGQIGVLLGRNGCGKTTLFKSILGIHKISKGSVCLKGENLLKLPRAKRARQVAYVPQDIRFGALTVFDSVLLGRISYFGLKTTKEDYQAVEKILKDMGLESYAQRNVDELSGGERQKIAIARAMAQAPALMIFDEPTGNLDIANEHLIMAEAKKLAREKKMTILCSLHDLNQALELGDRFFLMKNGVVKYAGGPEIITEEVIYDIFDIRVKILEVDGRRLVLGNI